MKLQQYGGYLIKLQGMLYVRGQSHFVVCERSDYDTNSFLGQMGAMRLSN